MMQHNMIPYREIQYGANVTAKPYIQNNPTQQSTKLKENEVDSTTQYNTIQNNTIPDNTMKYNTMQDNAMQCD